MTECSTQLPKDPRDNYPAALEHVWAAMRKLATKPYGTIGGVPTFVVEVSLPVVIQELWPKLKSRDAKNVATHVSVRLRSTHHIGTITKGTRTRTQVNWVADTYRPGEPAATSPLMLHDAPPSAVEAAPTAVPVDLQALLSTVLDVVGGGVDAENERLKAENRQLTDALAAERSLNDSLRKWIQELIDEQRLHADKGVEILELTA